jgi:phage shock protein E
MLASLMKIFGISPKVDFKIIVSRGAQIIDVRSPSEYQTGHVKGSINIPLQSLTNQTAKLNKNIPVITCCASGMRSASAKNILQSQGFSEVYNGGGWASLRRKLS